MFAKNSFTAFLIFVFVLLLSISSQGYANAINYCIYDPLGASGDYYSMAQDYQLAAKRWDVELKLTPYTNDSLAVDDFNAGHCDIVNMIGLRARLFNTFTGTIDAPGAVEDNAQMRTVVQMMTSPKISRYMINGQYEMAGLLPLGACYNYMHDRNITTVAQFAGKKISVMAWDKVEFIIANEFGAIPIPSEPTTFGGMFNKGEVDVLIGPLLLYRPFELYKGLGDKGGISRRPVLQLTMQVFIRRSKFPDGFGELSRKFVASQQARAFSIIHNVENGIDPRFWVYLTTPQRDEYANITRQIRARLAKEGFYDKTMLNILKRVRCNSTQSPLECSDTDE